MALCRIWTVFAALRAAIDLGKRGATHRQPGGIAVSGDTARAVSRPSRNLSSDNLACRLITGLLCGLAGGSG